MIQRYQPQVLGMVLAGGKGERLMPLTAQRTKPAIPFGGKYRIVDFVLSNFVNSGFLSIYVLVQYRSQSLIEHLRRAWRIGGRIQNNFITVVPPQMKAKGTWYEGTADAAYQNINLIQDANPDLVAVFGADHIYRMDINQMVQFHVMNQSEVTVAALPVSIKSAKGFGVMEVDSDQRIIGFEEKPKFPKPMPNNREMAYSSMGNYLFNADALVKILKQDARRRGLHDFGKDILPNILQSNKVMAYNFLDNEVPGLQASEEHGYWRDVGTLDAYWSAHMDLLGEQPRFNLHNDDWPILTRSSDGPAASVVRSHLDDTIIGQGSRLIEADIKRSVIGRNVYIGRGARIEESIIMDNSVIGEKAQLRRVIVDRLNLVPDGAEIGVHAKTSRDKKKIVVLPRGLVPPTRPSD